MQSTSVLAILALAFGCALAFDATLNQQWDSWKQVHSKAYTTAEELLR